MKKILTVISAITLCVSAFACSDIFINKGGYHVEARSMDFGVNIANVDSLSFVGQKNTTDVVVNASAIPATQLLSWTNKYGYWSRNAFNTPVADEGMNTAGFSISGLYLSGSQMPQYSSKDTRPVLAYMDIPAYLLSQVATVDQALQLLSKVQVVDSAVEVGNGMFLRSIPIHMVMRDKTGNSAVIEFIDGKVVIYQNAGNVLTNGPTYDVMLDTYKKSLDIEKDPNLVGLPGDYTNPSRFVRGGILTDVMPAPTTTSQAIYQANFVINTLQTPALNKPGKGEDSATIWTVVKDLDNQVVYVKDILFYQNAYKVVPTSIANGYQIIDLKSIDFNVVPMEYQYNTIQPTPANEVKKIIDPNKIAAFGA